MMLRERRRCPKVTSYDSTEVEKAKLWHGEQICRYRGKEGKSVHTEAPCRNLGAVLFCPLMWRCL